MKEFTVGLGDTLMQGLAPDPDAQAGQYVARLGNLYPGRHALQRPPAITPLGTSAWPFPQVFGGRKQTLVAGETSLESWDGSAYTDLRPTETVTVEAEYTLAGLLLTDPIINGLTWSRSGTTVTLSSPYQAASYAPGDLLVLCDYSGLPITSLAGDGPAFVIASSGTTSLGVAFQVTVTNAPTPAAGGFWYIHESPTTTETVTTTIPAGGVWHFADFQETWTMTNGTCQIVRTPLTGIDVYTAPVVQTCCNLRDGRLVLGGFDATEMATYISGFDSYLTNAPTDVAQAIAGVAAADTHWVWWSSIGGGDAFHFWNGATAEEVLEFISYNQSGWAPMPWRGTVQQILETVDGVNVYGTGGVTRLRAYNDPLPTMAPMPIEGLRSGVGVASRSSAAGTEFLQWFIDQENYLWRIAGNEAERLGYREQIVEAGSNLMLHYDPSPGLLWISGATCSFVLGPRGMGGPFDARISGLGYHAGTRVGAGIALQRQWVPIDIQTRPYDLGDRGFKQVTTVQVDASGVDNIEVGVCGGDRAPANAHGVAFPRRSEIEPYVRVTGRATGHDPTHVYRIELRYQAEDMRFRRGAKGVAMGTEQEAGSA